MNKRQSGDRLLEYSVGGGDGKTQIKYHGLDVSLRFRNDVFRFFPVASLDSANFRSAPSAVYDVYALRILSPSLGLCYPTLFVTLFLYLLKYFSVFFILDLGLLKKDRFSTINDDCFTGNFIE